MVTNEQRPMLRFLIVQTAASVVGLQCGMILFNNFAVEIAGLDVRRLASSIRCARSQDSWPN